MYLKIYVCLLKLLLQIIFHTTVLLLFSIIVLLNLQLRVGPLSNVFDGQQTGQKTGSQITNHSREKPRVTLKNPSYNYILNTVKD